MASCTGNDWAGRDGSGGGGGGGGAAGARVCGWRTELPLRSADQSSAWSERHPATATGWWPDGGCSPFGDARFLGSTGGIPLNQPIVDMERTPTGDGYWLVAADSGIFNFGAAGFHGSAARMFLSAPVVGMSRTSTGAGCHLAEIGGATVSFGDAPDGFVEPVAPPRPAGNGGHAPRIVGIMPTPQSGGYWQCDAGGAVQPAGEAQAPGGLAGAPLVRPIVGCDASLDLSG